jgi:YD repeat-containing protein
VEALTDVQSNATQQSYNLQGRLTLKQYPDTSTVAYTYETTTSRLKSVTDALSQVKTYAYARDDRLTAITYTGAVNPTPNVSFTYDPYFPRLTAMTDGTGTRQYTYVPVGSLGALQLQQDSGPLASSAITSAYDALGRLSQRTVQGAGAETFQYDAIGRLSVHANDLGTFTLGYLGQTDQIASRQLASSTLATAWSYLTNTGDRRLAGIANTGLTAGQFSNFTYTTAPENFITGITESSDAAAVYPASSSQTATYNTLNQLINLSGQARTFDANGNLTADGQRTYAWDAENRLVGIGYPGTPARRPSSPTTASAAAPRSAARPRPAAALPSRRTCGATRKFAKQGMHRTPPSAAITPRVSTCPARQHRRCTTVSTRSDRCAGCSQAPQVRLPTATIRTVCRSRPPRRRPTSSMAACSSMPTTASISRTIGHSIRSLDDGYHAIFSANSAIPL